MDAQASADMAGQHVRQDHHGGGYEHEDWEAEDGDAWQATASGAGTSSYQPADSDSGAEAEAGQPDENGWYYDEYGRPYNEAGWYDTDGTFYEWT